MNKRMLTVSGNKTTPKTEPAPSNSRTVPNNVKAQVNPNPIPIPSNILFRGVFLQAKASARPKIIQLTTISGIYIPSDLSSSGVYALMSICKIDTKAAITTTKTGILTLSGVTSLIQDMAKLEQISTNIVASPMDNPLIALVVVASVGHIPRRSTNVGFSLIRPFIKILIYFMIYPFFTCFEAPLFPSTLFWL